MCLQPGLSPTWHLALEGAREGERSWRPHEGLVWAALAEEESRPHSCLPRDPVQSPGHQPFPYSVL